MGSPIVDKLKQWQLNEGEVAVCFLGQAGLLIRAYPNEYFVVDPYLSDYCCDVLGMAFKRLTPTVLEPTDLDELPIQAYLMTHHHEDHLDVPTVVALKNRHFHFYAPPFTIGKLEELGIEKERCFPLHKDDPDLVYTAGPATISAVFADHGDLAPDAIGIIFECHGKRIYHMGDTCLNLEAFSAIGKRFSIDLLFAPINGRYGNMNDEEAVQAISVLSPAIAVPVHFWMLPANSGGDPENFLKQASSLTKPLLMAAGDILVLKP